MSVKIGVVGLGSIAQKAWLPVLARADEWTLMGGFSPDQQKAQAVCDRYRMRCWSRMDELAVACDAVFVHSSTASHYQVVRALLELGVDVCVDKPLAATLSEAEALVELAQQRGRKLMVAFNRRFAPRYQQLKAELAQPAALRMEKHRSDSVGPQDLRFTLLDDYLHVIDTALWLAAGEVKLLHGVLHTSPAGEMVYGEHHFSVGTTQVTTSMHRRAGTQRETVSAIADGGCWQLDEMREWRHERGGEVMLATAPAWQTTQELRGFDGAARHFIRCVQNQTMPETSGEEALKAQRIIESLWRQSGTNYPR